MDSASPKAVRTREDLDRNEALTIALLGQRKGDATIARNVEIEKKIAKLEVRGDTFDVTLARLQKEIDGCYRMAEEQEQALYGRTNCLGLIAEQKDLREDFEDFKSDIRNTIAALAEESKHRVASRTQVVVALIAALTAMSVPFIQFTVGQIYGSNSVQQVQKK